MTQAREVESAVTVLDGSTFVICDPSGDVGGFTAASGFFAADTRFLSRLVLTLDGERARPVSFEQAAPHVATFELEGPGRLEAEADELRARFGPAFWLPALGWYALGLDRDKRPIDALASNMGHLLWSGLVAPEHLDEVADRLVSGPLWSGWGIRTLASDEPAFDPLEYHNGTVWPHDNSLIAYGLARAGRDEEVQSLVRAVHDCAPFFEHRLPELFAGYERRAGEPPGVVPTSARPQAWAAGTPILLLRALLGLEPDPATRRLRVTGARLPEWADGLALTGVHAFGRRFDIRVEGGVVRVDSSR